MNGHLFIDYQNVHLTGYENYATWNSKPHESLIHPGRFASEIQRLRTSLTITEIHVFRGLPDPRREGRINSFVSRQHRMWLNDPRVKVHTRSLRYPRDWPTEKAQEKGVDVMLALAVVRCALARSAEKVIVATRDTDVLPAIEMADAEHPGCVAIASWENAGTLRPDCSADKIIMNAESFKRSLDPNKY